MTWPLDYLLAAAPLVALAVGFYFGLGAGEWRVVFHLQAEAERQREEAAQIRGAIAENERRASALRAELLRVSTDFTDALTAHRVADAISPVREERAGLN